MRVMTMDQIKEIIAGKDELVKRVIEEYNSKPTTKVKAIRGGTRRKRCPDEQRVLDSFKLK